MVTCFFVCFTSRTLTTLDHFLFCFSVWYALCYYVSSFVLFCFVGSPFYEWMFVNVTLYFFLSIMCDFFLWLFCFCLSVTVLLDFVQLLTLFVRFMIYLLLISKCCLLLYVSLSFFLGCIFEKYLNSSRNVATTNAVGNRCKKISFY
uniref:(northern house mosquito) hypothetical protein n=1 Tax=Culex pipiens TaxID=7175 RepID=A0A8D8B6B4_CULPI